MKSLLVVFSCIVVSACAYGQTEKESMKELLTERRTLECSDYRYNAANVLPSLYERGQLDSAFQVLDFLREECYEDWLFGAARTVLSLETGTFAESLYDSTVIMHMIWYRRAAETLQERDHLPYWGAANWRDQEVSNRFFRWIHEVGRKQLGRYEEGSIERLWAEFFAWEFTYVFAEIKSARYSLTDLREYYQAYATRALDETDDRGVYTTVFAGIWTPNFREDVIGTKPEIGFAAGTAEKWWRLELWLTGRFLNARRSYLVDHAGVRDSTDSFSSLAFGLDIGRLLYSGRTVNFELFTGVGYESLFHGEYPDDDSKAINNWSFAGYLGLRQRLFVDRYKRYFVALTARYSFVDFTQDGPGTDLSGNTLSINLAVGWGKGSRQKDLLDPIDYFE